MTPPAAAPVAAPSPRNFYDAEYHFAEDVQRPNERRIRRALRHLPLKGATHLDLGCGAGWAARMARVEGGTRRTIGIDFSRTALELARRHTPQVLWVQADGTALPIAAASIDTVHCDGALEHFPDPHKGLREIARILRPGGRGVIIVPNFYVKTEQPLEFRATYGGWKSSIEAAGLTVDHTGTDWGPPVLGAKRSLQMLKRVAGKVISIIPRMQYQFVFVVRRRNGMRPM